MNSNLRNVIFTYWRDYTQLPKTFLALLLISLLTITPSKASDNPSEKRISVAIQNGNLSMLFSDIEKQTSYKFLYNDQILDLNQTISINENNKTVDEILNKILTGLECNYTILEDNLIVITPKNDSKANITIKGKVTDISTDEGIPGANVYLKTNKMQGTITDMDGNYTLEVPGGESTLVFSFIGFNNEEIEVGSSSVIDVALIPGIESLDEVVVVGYGTQKKSDLTGSVMKVGEEDIPNVSVSNPVQSLQGQVSGVAVLTDNQPGSRPTLRIRGSGSINAGNDPLYVVDGFPLMNGDINDINMSDIESFEILKDASSSAIYGSRGANGVVIITTKKGAKGMNEVSFNTSYGIQTAARLPELLERDDFIDFINEAYTYSSGSPVYDDDNPAPEYNTDWQDEAIKDQAAIKNISLSFRGGNEATTYMLSTNLFDQDGLLEASGYNKFTARTNVTHEFNNWLKVGTNLQAGRSSQDIRDNATGDIFRYGWPTFPIKDEEGEWYYANQDANYSSYIEGTFNPVAEGKEVTDNITTDRLLGDIFVELNLGDHLTFRSNFGVDLSSAKEYEYGSTLSSLGINNSGYGEGGQTYSKQFSRLNENILTYSNVFNHIHRLSLTGVYSYQDYTYEDLYLYGTGFTSDETGANDMSLADEDNITYSSDKYSNKLASYTARVSYVLMDRYMLTATGRYDGSSRFGSNHKWGFFPSVGLGWRVNEESFMSDMSWISNLKLRASWGQTGNQEIDNYLSLQSLSSVYYIFDSSPILGYETELGNPDLKWEKTTQIDLGIDLSLYNRIDLAVDYYTRRTNDLLFDVPIPTTSGYTSMYQNVGEVMNKGFEVSAHVRIIDRKFKWDVSGNIANNSNEITKLYNDVESINLGSYSAGLAKYLKVGDPVSGIWARESAGIINSDAELQEYQEIRSGAEMGEEMYVDHDDDNSISTSDYICIGSTEPDFTYGISTSFEYKNLRLDIYGFGTGEFASIAGVDNNSGYGTGYSSSTCSYLLYGENQILNSNYIPTKYAYDRMWSESNNDGEFPRAGAQGVYLSDRTNGGWKYFVLKSVKLTYDLKTISKLNNMGWLKKASCFIDLQNYMNYANHRGYNPENGDVSYPWSKTVLLGLSTKF